jgi:inorganic pyrophosphatase
MLGQAAEAGTDFWLRLDQLAAGAPITIDRPRGTRHPRYPDMIYPLDYGFLGGTRSMDGGGLDVWFGSLAGRVVTAVVVCADSLRGDVELKLLLGCTRAEAQQVLALHNSGAQSALLIERPETGTIER